MATFNATKRTTKQAARTCKRFLPVISKRQQWQGPQSTKSSNIVFKAYNNMRYAKGFILGNNDYCYGYLRLYGRMVTVGATNIIDFCLNGKVPQKAMQQWLFAPVQHADAFKLAGKRIKFARLGRQR